MDAPVGAALGLVRLGILRGPASLHSPHQSASSVIGNTTLASAVRVTPGRVPVALAKAYRVKRGPEAAVEAASLLGRKSH